MKKVAATGPPAAAATRTGTYRVPGSATQGCGSGVSVNSVTSCSFAEIVAQEWRDNGGGSITIEAWSPVTQRSYVMRCTAGVPTVCRGGDNAAVYIR